MYGWMQITTHICLEALAIGVDSRLYLSEHLQSPCFLFFHPNSTTQVHEFLTLGPEILDIVETERAIMNTLFIP